MTLMKSQILNLNDEIELNVNTEWDSFPDERKLLGSQRILRLTLLRYIRQTIY